MLGNLQWSQKRGLANGVLDRDGPEGLEGFGPALTALKERAPHQKRPGGDFRALFVFVRDAIKVSEGFVNLVTLVGIPGQRQEGLRNQFAVGVVFQQ